MTPPALCHMSRKPAPPELVHDGRVDCYSCGRSVLVRGDRYADHRIRLRRKVRSS